MHYYIPSLTGLNDTFDMVRSQILLMDPLPPINKVFSMVLQHERQFASVNSCLDVEEPKISVNASYSRRPQGRGRGSYGGSIGQNSSMKRYCTYCGKDNHIVENCYKKHGYPPNFGKSVNANSANVEDQFDIDDVKSTRGSDSFTLEVAKFNTRKGGFELCTFKNFTLI
jgi:hypothetical protein